MTDSEATDIVRGLTNAGSEFQREVMTGDSSTPVSLVHNRDGAVVAWSATHRWKGLQTLEGFTSNGVRRQGMGRLAAAALVADGHVDTAETVAVFAPHYISIARDVGFRSVRLYERKGSDWVEVS